MGRAENQRLDEETLASLCLGHLAEHPENLAEFMGIAGYTPQSLRGAVGTEQFGRGLIDYFAADEPLLLALCANKGIGPEDFMRVWHKLNPAG